MLMERLVVGSRSAHRSPSDGPVADSKTLFPCYGTDENLLCYGNGVYHFAMHCKIQWVTPTDGNREKASARRRRACASK